MLPIFAILRVTPASEVVTGGPDARATAMPNRTRASTETAPTAASTIDAAARTPPRLDVLTLGISGQPRHSQRREGGHLDEPGGDTRPRPDLLEPEQPDPHRYQGAAEGGQRE